MIDFKNKKILITGATGGIGGSLVKKFISLNGDVLGTGTKEDKLKLLQKESSNGVKGVIIGRALYDKKFTFSEALSELKKV